MATIHYWIQLENRPWDVCPNNIDRITGQDMKAITTKDPVEVTLHSPGTGFSHVQRMFAPLRDGDGVLDALILRRYKPPQKPDQSDAWTVPDDRKVNPWDLNEHDPTDTGTMGTIPGPVIECNVGDAVILHFRNLDRRTQLGTKKICFPSPFPFPLVSQKEICFDFPFQVPIPIEKRVHSLHPHGFVFAATSDGAYPLSPPDSTQPIPPSEAVAWASVPGFSGQFKKGDRVPPGGTFNYSWNTIGWPTTAGVWLYHDHSICDMENVERGAIGIIVIHNPADKQQEVDIRAGDQQDPSKLDPAFLPGGSPNGDPRSLICFPLSGDNVVRILPHHLEAVSQAAGGHAAMAMDKHKLEPAIEDIADAEGEVKGSRAIIGRPTLQHGDFSFQLAQDLIKLTTICFPVFRKPPIKGLYLQLFHTLSGAAGMAINGRSFLGNTPTIVSGTETLMRFGVVGMGSDMHTFHIHGHRWIIPGPDGNTLVAIQGSPQVKAVSQFEDTRIFGPANSFVFTIDGKSGSFMRAGGRAPEDSVGEWHMHCHVLAHMMTGMMGSLLIIKGGELAFGLPAGVPCEMPKMGGMGNGENGEPKTVTVHIQNFQFSPSTVTINVGDSVRWQWDADDHSTTSDTGVWDSGIRNAGALPFTQLFNTAGTFPYHCIEHGGMHGTVIVNP